MKPKRYGAQTLYNSKILSDISLQHWESFDNAVKSIEGLKIGDSIDVAVNTTAIQLVKFSQCQSIDELKTKAKSYIDEIQKEVYLKNNTTLTTCQAGNDGQCSNENCPQNTGKSCPLPHWSDNID